LITVAVENAKEEDRFWIQDLHQNIFCGSSGKTRLRVFEVVGGWRKRFGRPRPVDTDQLGLADLTGDAQRACANGDVVGELGPSGGRLSAATAGSLPLTVGKDQHAEDGRSSRRPGLSVRSTPSKPDGPDRRYLNGFGIQEASQPEGATGVPNDEAVVDTARTRPDNVGKGLLNGFVLRGGNNNDSGVGFSFGASGR